MKPDFLCIGAQKSGTTWLYHNLGLHPQIWLPIVKELHHFNRPSSTLYKRILGTMSCDRIARSKILEQFYSLRFLRAPRDLHWLGRYLLRKRGDQ